MPLPARPRPPYASSAEEFADFANMNDSWVVKGPDNLSVTDASFPNLEYNDEASWGGETAEVPIVTPSRKKINERESSWFNDEPIDKGIQRKTYKKKQLWFPMKLDRLGEEDVESIAESIAQSTSLSLAGNTSDASKYEGLPTKDVARGFVVEQKRMEVLEYSRRLLKGKTISEVKDGIVTEVKGLIATRSTPHSLMPRRASIGGTSEHSHQSDWGSAHGAPRRKSLGIALGALPDQSPVGARQSLSGISSRRGSGNGANGDVTPRSKKLALSRGDSSGYSRAHASPRASPYAAKQRIGRCHSAESFNRLALTQGQVRSPRRPTLTEDDSEGTMRTAHTVDTLERGAASPKKARRSSMVSKRGNDSLTSKLHISRRSSSTVSTALDDSSFYDSFAEGSVKQSKPRSFTSDGSVCSRARPSRRQSLTGHPSMSSYPSSPAFIPPTPTLTTGPELVLDRAPASGRTQLMRSNSGSTLRSNTSSSGSSKVSSPRGVTRLPPSVPITNTPSKSIEATPRRATRRLSQHSSMGTRAPSPAARTLTPRASDTGMNSLRQHRSQRASPSGQSLQEPSTMNRSRQIRRSSMNI
jgi:hypothetical protein